MDRPTDELLQKMLAAVVGAFGSDERVDRLVDEARAEAEAEVKDLLRAAIKATLLQRAVSRLGSDTPASGPFHSNPGARTEPGEPPTGETGCYVYGITHSNRTGLPADLVAVDDRWPVRNVDADGLRAVVSDVSLSDFGQDAIAEHAQDLDWVERKVRAHDRVLKALLDGPVVPCRFGTILRSEQDVRRLLDRHHESLARALEALEGKKEWGVKISTDFDGRAGAAGGAGDAVTGAASSGRAYFLQKKRDEQSRAEAARAQRAAADGSHRELSAAAAAATLVGARERGGGGPLVNGAYLVADGEVRRFHELVGELAQRHRPLGLSFDVTGPWPPYNFVSLDLALAPETNAPAEPGAAA